jgi:hypothetical protein
MSRHRSSKKAIKNANVLVSILDKAESIESILIKLGKNKPFFYIRELYKNYGSREDREDIFKFLAEYSLGNIF